MRLKPIIAMVTLIGAGIVFILAGVDGPIANAAPATDACSLLTQGQVSDVLGVPVGAANRLVPNSPKVCGWAPEGGFGPGGKKVVVTVITPQTFANGKAASKNFVSGIGDDAYYTTSSGIGTALNVLKGSSGIQMRLYGFPPEQITDIEKTLAQEALDKL